MNKIVTRWLMIAGVIASFYGKTEAQRPFTGSLFPSGKPHALEGAFSLYRFDYKEGLVPPLKSTEGGWLPGLHLALSRQGTSPALFGRAAFDFTRANTTYDGSAQDSLGNVFPYLSTTENTFLNVSGSIGVTFTNLSNPPRALTAYTGIGYRFWERGLGGTGGYREHYSWRYVPAGLRLDYRANREVSGAVDASVRFMFGGTIDVFLSDLPNGWRDLHLTLGNRPGFRVEAPMYFRYWVFAPWYEYSAIAQSNQERIYYQDGTPVIVYRNGIPYQYVAHEPSSTTHQFGLNVGARVAF